MAFPHCPQHQHCADHHRAVGIGNSILYDADDPIETLLWSFDLLAYVAVPALCILGIYIYSFTVSVSRHTTEERVFLFFHIPALLLLILIGVFCHVPEKKTDPFGMEANYIRHAKDMDRLIGTTCSWLPDSTFVEINFSRRGKIIGMGVFPHSRMAISNLSIADEQPTEEEWAKIGFTANRRDSLYKALKKMNCTGITIENFEKLGYSELFYATTPGYAYSYRIYRHDCIDSLLHAISADSTLIVYNRRVVFQSIGGKCFPDRGVYLKQR